MTDIEVPVTRPAGVTLACLCNTTLQAGESKALQIVVPHMYAQVYTHGCHLTSVHYERAKKHISTFEASGPTGS